VNNYYIIYNIWKVLKCGAGEERRRLAGPIVREKKYYTGGQEYKVKVTPLQARCGPEGG
jgi:hypothetical protein